MDLVLEVSSEEEGLRQRVMVVLCRSVHQSGAVDGGEKDNKIHSHNTALKYHF